MLGQRQRVVGGLGFRGRAGQLDCLGGDLGLLQAETFRELFHLPPIPSARVAVHSPVDIRGIQLQFRLQVGDPAEPLVPVHLPDLFQARDQGADDGLRQRLALAVLLDQAVQRGLVVLKAQAVHHGQPADDLRLVEGQVAETIDELGQEYAVLTPDPDVLRHEHGRGILCTAAQGGRNPLGHLVRLDADPGGLDQADRLIDQPFQNTECERARHGPQFGGLERMHLLVVPEQVDDRVLAHMVVRAHDDLVRDQVDPRESLAAAGGQHGKAGHRVQVDGALQLLDLPVDQVVVLEQPERGREHRDRPGRRLVQLDPDVLQVQVDAPLHVPDDPVRDPLDHGKLLGERLHAERGAFQADDRVHQLQPFLGMGLPVARLVQEPHVPVLAHADQNQDHQRDQQD